MFKRSTVISLVILALLLSCISAFASGYELIDGAVVSKAKVMDKYSQYSRADFEKVVEDVKEKYGDNFEIDLDVMPFSTPEELKDFLVGFAASQATLKEEYSGTEWTQVS